MGTDESDARIIVRRIVLPLLVGVGIGFGIGELPMPANLIAVLALAVAGIAYSVWAIFDLGKSKRRLEKLAAEAQAYIDSYDRHPRTP